MAKRDVGGCQFTFYFPTIEDKNRWRKLAEPYTLNRWMYLTIEKAIDASTQPTTDPIYDYSYSALHLEIMMLRDKIKMLEEKQAQHVEPTQPENLDKRVVDLLRSGGSWPSTKIIKKLGTDRSASINNTLEQLAEIGLVRLDWRGWSWI